jgi:hypothetical protein
MNFIHHWIYEDLWVPVWPNWFAGAAVGILGYVWGKKELIKIHNKLDLHHRELKRHLTKLSKKGKK